MQFKKSQRAELARTWNQNSWFYTHLGTPAREVVEAAYGLKHVEPQQRRKAQETINLVLALFAHKIGAEKAQVAHAMLSGSVDHLTKALVRKGTHFTEASLIKAWGDCFREANMGSETNG